MNRYSAKIPKWKIALRKEAQHCEASEKYKLNNSETYYSPTRANKVQNPDDANTGNDVG